VRREGRDYIVYRWCTFIIVTRPSNSTVLLLASSFTRSFIHIHRGMRHIELASVSLISCVISRLVILDSFAKLKLMRQVSRLPAFWICVLVVASNSLFASLKKERLTWDCTHCHGLNYRPPWQNHALACVMNCVPWIRMMTSMRISTRLISYGFHGRPMPQDPHSVP
jgi:hypothetical protein